jgi:hypothetical protein
MVEKDNKQDEEIQAFIIFGDINRSMTWLRRPSSQEKKRELLHKIRDEIDRFEKKDKFQMKRSGDGFISVMEVLDAHKKCQTLHILEKFMKLGNRLNEIIKKSPFPRPEGYRMRFVVGSAFKEKLATPDGFVLYGECQQCKKFKKIEWYDFIGYGPHLCHRILSVRRDIPFIVHESVKDMLSDNLIKKHGLHFEKLFLSSPFPDEVDEEDLHLLYAVNKKKMKNA